jgi:hypothetical protein
MSSQPIDTQFFKPLLHVGIAALYNSYETQAMRALSEMLDCYVSLHRIGTPGDFLKVLSMGENAPRYLIITGHGDEAGFDLGEYADFIDTSMLKGRYLPPEAVAPVVNLPGCTVISATCWGGIEPMGRAFTADGKVNAYIGCRRAPNGNAMCVFLVNFLHGVLDKKLSDRDAWLRAVAATDHSHIYEMSFFHPSGLEERYPIPNSQSPNH